MLQTRIFQPTDVLLPHYEALTAPELWSVIACDQYTADYPFWISVAENIAQFPSTYHMILPEIYLERDSAEELEEKIAHIHTNMKSYIEGDILACYPDSLVYVKRVQENGVLREGLVGMIDLEYYDYTTGSCSAVRATEGTVLERIPPRKMVRKGASLDCSHVMILIDDPEDKIMSACREHCGEVLYHLPCLGNIGHTLAPCGELTGYLLNDRGKQVVLAALANYEASSELPYAVGDGNHSLATAKSVYEEYRSEHPNEDCSMHPLRYALVELINIHSEALQFEAIHRIVKDLDTKLLRKYLIDTLGLSHEKSSQSLELVEGNTVQTYYIHKPSHSLSVGSVRDALDCYLAEHGGKVDYIHGRDSVMELCEEDADILGILLPDFAKAELFASVARDGALPRKTFSMGAANDKRFYLECRKI